MTRVMMSVSLNDAKSNTNHAYKTLEESQDKKNERLEIKDTSLQHFKSQKETEEDANQKDENQEKKKKHEVASSETICENSEEASENQMKMNDTENDEMQQVDGNDATEVPPAKDTQLRRNYLQRIYRQLQSTHPTQDDAKTRQLATNMEMETCQNAATRNQYITAMEHAIHKLMEFELEQTNDTQGFESIQSHTFEYVQALAKAQEQNTLNACDHSGGFSTPRSTTSFQSLMGQQFSNTESHQGNQLNGFKQMDNIPHSSLDTSFYPPPWNVSFSNELHNRIEETTCRNMMETRQDPHLQQSKPNQSRVTTFQDFSAQIQHLDKSILIELLWNQRNALARWQHQAKQLEFQLQNVTNNFETTSFTSPMGKFVNPHVSAEAEVHRSRDRHTLRMAQQQRMTTYSYGHSWISNASDKWEKNAQTYWERVRALKVASNEKLRTALRALAHHTAPPNSIYSIKAQSMMQNIVLVLNILNEQPSSVQPRKFDVLDSIERFMQMSVNPIVQKVQSSVESRGSVASHTSKGDSRDSKTEKEFNSRYSEEITSQEMESKDILTSGMNSSNDLMNEFNESSNVLKGDQMMTRLKSPVDEVRSASLSSEMKPRESSNKRMEENVDETLNEFSELADINFEDPNILEKEYHSFHVKCEKDEM
ncbi:hypothetical protein Plhal703r1_c15g0072161 [Plasmopara halstedii]